MEILRLLVFVLVGFGTSHCDKQYVTCQSAVKLINQEYNVKLFTSEMKYQGGSGQYAVTGYPSKSPDPNTYWVIRGTADTPCQWGHPLRCGSHVRLMHMMTNRNLHSHYVSAPLSGGVSSYNEVSAFGEKGEGDSGDNWFLRCLNAGDEYWRRGTSVEFLHSDTGELLAATERTYDEPIQGYREIVGAPRGRLNKATLWLPGEGVYINPNSPKEVRVSRPGAHTEL